jgi:hypothetical protein
MSRRNVTAGVGNGSATQVRPFSSVLHEHWKLVTVFVSAFVTGGALFGIKLIGRDDKHIVALDTDAVKNRADDRARLARSFRASKQRSGGLLGIRFGGHEAILAWGCRRPIVGRQHPWGPQAHLLYFGIAGF